MVTDPNEEKIDRLFAAVLRAEPYKEDIEYGFETRLMARIRDEQDRLRPLLVWAWRLIPVFISIVVFLGIWTYESRYSYMTDLSVMAAIGNEESTTVAFLAGE